MSFIRATTFALTVFVLAQLASGQPSLLNQVEQGLQPPGAGAGAAGTAPLGYFGAELDDVGEEGRGVRVKSVRPGTPAEASGLKQNDLIIDIDGKKIGNLDDYDSIAQRPVNTKLVFTVDRGGKKQPLAVKLGTRPAAATIGDQAATAPQSAAPTLSPPGTAPSLSPPGPGSFGLGSQPPSTLPAPSTIEPSPRGGGITAQPLDARPPGPDSAGPLPLPGASAGSGGASLGISVLPSDQARASNARRRGAYIAGVKAGSPAAHAGLPTGGVIVQVDGRPINSDDDLIAAIRAARPGQEVELTYYDSNDRLGKKLVRLAEAGAAPATAGAPGGFAAPGGGFGAPIPGSTPTPDASSRPGLGGRSRPLLNQVERMAENLGRGAGLVPSGPLTTTTVYDPLAMAALQKTVAELTVVVSSLEERLRAIESRSGGASGGSQPLPPGSPSQFNSPPSPAFGSPQTPGFSVPQPSITPGFGTPTAPPGTNP